MGRRRGTLTLRREDGRVLCDTCTVADTTMRRLRGLLGRSGLKTGEGIVLRPAWSIHSAFMRFPIDVVFLDPDQTVIRIEPAMRPWHTASCRGAREVVELAAGECERRGLEVGDRVAWASTPTEDELPTDAAPPVPVPTVDARVVIATHDRRFEKLIRFLLSREGIDAQVSHRSDLLDLIEREHPDAVVLDPPGSLLDVVRAVADANARHPEVGVFVVSERAQDSNEGFPLFDKWDRMEEVVDAVTASLGLPPDTSAQTARPKAANL